MGRFSVTWEVNPRVVAPAARRYLEAAREMLLALVAQHYGLRAEVVRGEAPGQEENEEEGASPPTIDVAVLVTGAGERLWRLARDLSLLGWRRPQTRGLPPVFDLHGRRTTGRVVAPEDALAIAEDDALDELAFSFVGARRRATLDLQDP